MSYQLIIAEKPSVARSIAGVIGADKKQDGYMEGNGYLVSWCIQPERIVGGYARSVRSAEKRALCFHIRTAG